MKTIAPTTAEAMLRDWGKRILRLERNLGSLARDNVYPSSQRPDPNARPGLRIFDLDLNKPLWSNGTIWVDATGAAAPVPTPPVAPVTPVTPTPPAVAATVRMSGSGSLTAYTPPAVSSTARLGGSGSLSLSTSTSLPAVATARMSGSGSVSVSAVATAGLTRSGSALQVNGTTTRFSGANVYWLGLDDNAGTSSGSFPSHTTITAAITGVRQMGANLVRAHTVGISTGTSKSFETAAGVFSDANLDSADWAVYQAKLAGIYLMVPLTDNWNYYHGGKWNFVHWAYQQNSSGITDTPGSTKDDVNERIFFANTTAGLRVRALFKAYISAWLNHVNPYTGLAYKDDPTIAIVETGNEIYYASQLGTNEWTQDIASYVKSIAPRKLVADGSAADRVAVSSQPGLTASAVDIVGAHYYPQQQSGSYPPVEFNDSSAGYPAGTALQQLTADASAAAGGGKAFIVGEYPWTRSTVSSLYSALAGNSAISGDMFWSMIGGTETHGGAFGSDDFPVHRPYLSGSEATYAPALAAHISAVTGVATSGGA